MLSFFPLSLRDVTSVTNGHRSISPTATSSLEPQTELGTYLVQPISIALGNCGPQMESYCLKVIPLFSNRLNNNDYYW